MQIKAMEGSLYIFSVWFTELVNSPQYVILNILAFIFLLFFAFIAAKKFCFSRMGTGLFLIGSFISFIAGARFFYILFYTAPEWSLMFEPVPYGFSLFGSLLLVVVFLFVVALKIHLPVWEWMDMHTPGLIIYVTISKIGCFLNGCCFGTPTLMPWGIPYAEGSQAYNYYIVRALDNLQFQSWRVYSDLIHPVQLYESFLTLLLLIIALSLLKRRLMPGIVFLLVFGAYSLIRLGLFYFRAMPYDTHFYYLLAWIYTIIAVISFGILLMKLLRIKNELLLNRRVNQCN